MENKKLFGALLFGSVWGALEATLGAILHLGNSPYKGALMFSVGIFLISAAIQIYKPRNTIKFAFGIGLVASVLKCLDILLPGPQMTPLVVLRPAIAILVESLTFGALVFITQKNYEKNLLAKPVVGVLSSYLSYLGFGFLFAYLKLGSNYWLNKTFYEFLNIIVIDGSKTAIFCAPVTLAGFYAGNFAVKPYFDLSRSRFFYPTLSLIILCCWILVIA